MLHIDNLVPLRPGLERVEKFLGKRDGRFLKEEVGGGSERQNSGSKIANSPFNIFDKNIGKGDIEDYLLQRHF